MPTLNLGQVRFVPRGEYDNAASYNNLDVVFYKGISYFCTVPIVSGVTPTDVGASQYWQLLIDRHPVTESEVQSKTGTQTVAEALDRRSVIFTALRAPTSGTFDPEDYLETSTKIQLGAFCYTLGYYAPGDGGGNDYEIVAAGTGTDDGGSFIDLAGSGLQAKGLFGKTVNVRQFGAKGDGVTNDTNAVQNAINHVLSLFSSGIYRRVHISSGDYVLYSILEAAGGISIRGDGRNQTRLIWPSTSSSAGISVPYTTTSSLHLFDFRDMSLLKGGYGGTAIKVEGVSGGGSPEVHRGFVQNLDIKRQLREMGTGGWEVGIELIQVHGAVISACIFQGDEDADVANQYYGTFLKYSGSDGPSEVPAHINVVDCTARRARYGAYISRCEGIYFRDFRAFTVDRGIYHDNEGRSDPNLISPRITIIGGHISARECGVHLVKTQMAQIKNIYLLHANNPVNPDYKHIRITSSRNTLIYGNQIEGINGSEADGIYIEISSYDNAIEGNLFATSGGNAIYVSSSSVNTYIGRNPYRSELWLRYLQNNANISRIPGEKTQLLRATPQTIPNGPALIEFTSTPYNVLGLGFYDSLAPSAATIPVRGRYKVHAQVGFAENNVGSRFADIRINGGSAIGSGAMSMQAPPNGISYLTVSSDSLILNEGDEVSLYVVQTSGGNLDTLANATLSIEYIGEAN